MFKFLKNTCIGICIIISMFFLFSCGKEKGIYTDLLIDSFISNDGVYTYSVPSSQTTFNLEQYISSSENSSWKVSKNRDFVDNLNSGDLKLVEGDNLFYIKVEDKYNNFQIYKLNIIKTSVCTVTFDANGGTACTSQNLDSGSRITNIPITAREGYEFLGWDYDFSKPITENKTITAQWKPKEYTITIDMSQEGKENISVPVVFGEKYELKINRNGYVLNGFTCNGKSFDSSGTWNKNSSIIVVPVWQVENYKITYIIDNDDVVFKGKTSYTIEDEYVLPVLEHADYEFVGWYNGEEKITTIVKGTVGSITLRAKWQHKEPVIQPPKNINIIFDAKDTEFDKETRVIVLGDEYELPVPSKEGYLFEAWEVNGERIKISGIWTIDADETVTITLVWSEEKYDITYVLGDNVTNPNSEKTTYTINSDTYTLQDPTKEGYYNFIGWYTDSMYSEESKITEIKQGTIGDIILYAKFEKEQYTVTFDPNEGTISSTNQIVDYKDAYELLEPVRPGYKFVGWKNENENVLSSGESWDIRSDVTLIAEWEIVEYNIEYKMNNGKLGEGVTNPNKYTILSEPITLNNPTRLGYDFVGWKKEGSDNVELNVTIPTGTIGDLKYIAVWEASGYKYSYSNENGVKTATLVKYTYDGYATSCTVKETVTYQGEQYTVTKIGQEAFANLTGKIERVFLPSTLKEIGVDAFKNCEDLEIAVLNLPSEINIDDWADALIIGTGNKDVLEVIKGKRPKIGWSKYV